jgi:hypothetical protein
MNMKFILVTLDGSFLFTRHYCANIIFYVKKEI